MELQPFCSKDDMRQDLKWPFSIGQYTYATDGRLMVRVPRLADIPEGGKPKAETMFSNIADIALAPLPEFDLPEQTDGECEMCDGRGTMHDCPECHCECRSCGGTGVAPADLHVSVGYGDAIYACEYIRKIIELPGLVVAKTPTPKDPMYFKFDGGDGLLMPRASPDIEHIKISR